MAINYVVSYTFSPSTTISSSQVNTNTSDNANTWNGLELGTKSIAQIKVDADPTLALQLTTKQYVDHYSSYRRPVLQYNSGTVVNVETGLDGTSGDCTILFPDGIKRTDTVTGRIQCNLAQVAALSGSWQSGLRTGTVVNNTWYAIYAVKTTDDASKMVMVADTVFPTQGNFSTLNSNFNTNGWVYLGLIRYGDSSGTANAILKFVQAGNITRFYNTLTTTEGTTGVGILLATSVGTANLVYAYSAGFVGTVIANNISLVWFNGHAANTPVFNFADSGGTRIYGKFAAAAANAVIAEIFLPALEGLKLINGSSVACDICLSGFVDGVLGVGSNPIL